MAFRFPKEKAADKAGRESGDELSELRKENAHLRKTVEELVCQKGALSESENQQLLERILMLETLRERNSQQILSRDQEIMFLKQQLRAQHGEVLTSLELQLNQQRLKDEEREMLFQRLNKETEDVKNKMAAVCTKVEESGTTDGPSTSRDVAVIQEHLKDALEKNQQWLEYDQQREAYVKMLMERMLHLEQQLNQANEDLSTEVKRAKEEQQRCEELLEAEQERGVQGRRRLSRLQQKYEDQQQEVEEVRQQLQAEHLWGKKKLQEERRRSGECVERLNAELEEAKAMLEEERLNSAELQQQIQTSAEDLEDQKRENHLLQRQLCKILKKLRKAEDSVARLQSEKAQAESSEAGFEGQPQLPSPSRVHGVLDESFLECPKCRAPYPTSRHRELLAHIDECFE